MQTGASWYYQYRARIFHEKACARGLLGVPILHVQTHGHHVQSWSKIKKIEFDSLFKSVHKHDNQQALAILFIFNNPIMFVEARHSAQNCHKSNDKQFILIPHTHIWVQTPWRQCPWSTADSDWINDSVQKHGVSEIKTQSLPGSTYLSWDHWW